MRALSFGAVREHHREGIAARLLTAAFVAGSALAADGASKPGLRAQVPGAGAPEHWGQIVGQVVDASTGAPIQGAHLALRGLAHESFTDESGFFWFLAVPAGTFALELQHIAYGTQTAELSTRQRSTTRVEVRLHPAVIEVEPIAVQVEGAVYPWHLQRMGFYDRRDVGWGEYFAPAYFEERESVTFRTFLSTSATQHLSSRSAGCMNRRLRDRRAEPQRIGSGGGCCAPLITIDGRRDRVGLAPDLAMSDIGAIEVYRDASGAPIQTIDWTSARCGVVAIWLKRW